MGLTGLDWIPYAHALATEETRVVKETASGAHRNDKDQPRAFDREMYFRRGVGGGGGWGISSLCIFI